MYNRVNEESPSCARFSEYADLILQDYYEYYLYYFTVFYLKYLKTDFL